MLFFKDSLIAKDNSKIILTFYAHASVGIEWKGIHIYVDPVGEKYGVDFSIEPKADLILITHPHKDHLDAKAIEVLSKADTVVYASKECSRLILCEILAPHVSKEFMGVGVYSVPAYNTTEEHLQYHPIHDEGLGYVLNIGGTNIYFAGDTEDNEDVLSLKNVDIAFLSINQPYTMTVEQVVNVVKAICPSVLYPYHTGSQMGETDVTPLVAMLKGFCEVRIRNMK